MAVIFHLLEYGGEMPPHTGGGFRDAPYGKHLVSASHIVSAPLVYPPFPGTPGGQFGIQNFFQNSEDNKMHLLYIM